MMSSPTMVTPPSAVLSMSVSTTPSAPGERQKVSLFVPLKVVTVTSELGFIHTVVHPYRLPHGSGPVELLRYAPRQPRPARGPPEAGYVTTVYALTFVTR